MVSPFEKQCFKVSNFQYIVNYDQWQDKEWVHKFINYPYARTCIKVVLLEPWNDKGEGTIAQRCPEMTRCINRIDNNNQDEKCHATSSRFHGCSLLCLNSHYEVFLATGYKISFPGQTPILPFWSIVGHPGYVVNLQVSRDNVCNSRDNLHQK